MKRKELKNLAKKIAEAELNLQAAKTSDEEHLIEEQILFLSSRVTNLLDMIVLDDMVQELLSKQA